MDKVHVVISSDGDETEICGIYKQWSSAYEEAKRLEDQQQYDTVTIEEWQVK